jgi:glycosyltransferase involved in cell wall biosynthesis
MKILYVLHTAKPGGAAESLKVLLEEWRKADSGVEPLLALPRGAVWNELRKTGRPVFTLPPGLETRPRGPAQMAFAAGKVLLRQRVLSEIIRREKVDVVHSNSTAAHLAGGWAARRCGVPAVWHVRDLAPLGRWGGLLARQADAVVAISRAVAGALENQGVPRHKIHLIYNTLDVDAWPADTPPDAAMRQALSDGPVFGCVGQLVPWKNQAAFIEAAALLRRKNPGVRMKFAIIGSDPWQQDSAYRRDLLRMAAVSGLGRDLIFFPHQTDNKSALAACDVLVHGALSEPFGRVLIEAMALQKPVIAFDAAGPGEILTHGEDGLLAPPESGSAGLAEAMQKVLLTPDFRRKLGEAARRTVRQRFGAADGAARLRRLYESLR